MIYDFKNADNHFRSDIASDSLKPSYYLFLLSHVTVTILKYLHILVIRDFNDKKPR